MKNLLLTAMFFLTSLITFSQSLNKEVVEFKYRRLPTMVLNGIDSYHVEVVIDSLPNSYLHKTFNEEVQRMTYMHSLEKTENEGLKIKIRLLPLQHYRQKYQNPQDPEKGANQIFFKYPIKYEAFLPDTGERILHWDRNDGYSSYFTSFIMVANLDTQYENELRGGNMVTHKEKQLKIYAKSIGEHMRGYFDRTKWNAADEYYTVKKYKSFTYPDLDKAISNLQTSLAKMTYDDIQPSEELKQELRSGCIENWENALLTYAPYDKKARINDKIGKVLYENLFTLSMTMFQFDEATRYKEEYESKSGKDFDATLLERWKWNKKRYDVNYPD